MKNLSKQIPKEEFEEYYINLNHSQKEVAEHFSISISHVNKLVKSYNLHKSKDAHVEQIKKSKLQKYGDENYNNRESAKRTCTEKYGVDNLFKDREAVESYWVEKLGVDHPMRSDSIKSKVFGNRDYDKVIQKSRETYLNKTGYLNPFSNPEVKEKIQKTRLTSGQYLDLEKTKRTCLEKYGVEYPCMRIEARLNGTSDSSENKSFERLLQENGIEFEREFPIGKYSYDFKVGNILIEIDPSATHNSTWRPFHESGLDPQYHLNKTRIAEDAGYRCIHVFDWDDRNLIINLLKKRSRIFARQCVVCEVTSEDAKIFLNANHLQGYVRDKVRVALRYKNEIVSLMTFGKPRYNKKFSWELLRYCSTHCVVGGAEKLYQYFLNKYSPDSVVSYCDNSKFSGVMYRNLGFDRKNFSFPSKHWYSIKSKIHITDNLLRQHGFDRLFHTSFGKGTSNADLMLQNKFVEIYDCGQYRWEWRQK